MSDVHRHRPELFEDGNGLDSDLGWPECGCPEDPRPCWCGRNAFPPSPEELLFEQGWDEEGERMQEGG